MKRLIRHFHIGSYTIRRFNNFYMSNFKASNVNSSNLNCFFRRKCNLLVEFTYETLNLDLFKLRICGT